MRLKKLRYDRPPPITQPNGKRLYKDALAVVGIDETEYAHMLGLSARSMYTSSARDRYRNALILLVDRISMLDKPWAVCRHCGYFNRHAELPDTDQPAGQDDCVSCRHRIYGGPDKSMEG